MNDEIMLILKDYKRDAQEILKDHMERMILYGSYARGDYRDDSDIDIMFLVDLREDEIPSYRKRINYMTYDFNMENDADISSKLRNNSHFNHWKDASVFYRNIEEEGVVIE